MTDCCPHCGADLERHASVSPDGCELGIRPKGERITYECSTPLPLAVTTPTITGREQVFEGFRQRLAGQSCQPGAHIWIREDPSWQSGIANYVQALVRVRNDLLYRARDAGYEWAVTSDDDDEWQPDHLETLWRTHVEHPEARIIYALSHGWHALNGRLPELVSGQSFNPWGSMVNEAMLHLPSVLGVGGYIYRDGWNEDVLNDHYWVVECNIPRVFADHVTYEWVKGEHEHFIDDPKRAEQDQEWHARIGWDAPRV